MNRNLTVWSTAFAYTTLGRACKHLWLIMLESERYTFHHLSGMNCFLLWLHYMYMYRTNLILFLGCVATLYGSIRRCTWLIHAKLSGLRLHFSWVSRQDCPKPPISATCNLFSNKSDDEFNIEPIIMLLILRQLGYNMPEINIRTCSTAPKHHCSCTGLAWPIQEFASDGWI